MTFSKKKQYMISWAPGGGGARQGICPPWNSKNNVKHFNLYFDYKKFFIDIMSYDSMRGCPK